MTDSIETADRTEIEKGYFRQMIGDLAQKNEELTAENLRLRALLNVADINPDSDPQEIRNREIKREQQWYRMEDELERLRAALRPFVEIWRNWCENPDTFQRTISDSLFRRTAQALETEAQP